MKQAGTRGHGDAEMHFELHEATFDISVAGGILPQLERG